MGTGGLGAWLEEIEISVKKGGKMAKKSLARRKLVQEFSKGSRIYFGTSVLFALLGTIFFAMVPQIVRVTVDSILGTEPFDVPEFILHHINAQGGRSFFQENLYICGVFVLITAFISGIFQFYSRRNLAMASEGFLERLRNEIFRHLGKLPLSWHLKHQTGDMIQRATSDVDTIKKFTSIQVYEIFKVLFLLVFTLFLMFHMNPLLSAVAFFFLPLSLLYSYLFFGQISKKFQDTDEKEGVLSSVVQENLTGVRVVRAFGREAYELQRFDAANEAYAQAWIKMGQRNGIYWGGGDFITTFQCLVVAVGATFLVVSGEITTGEFIAFVSYNASLTWPVRTLGRMLVEMSKAFVAMDRISYILEAEPEQDSPEAENVNLIGDIVFKNVSFAYESQRQILKNLNFTIKQGTTFGILGKTGSGKSTLIHLINRLYELQGDSEITIAGTPIQKIKLSHLRKNVGVAFGEPFLFSKSILENIAISQESFTEKQVEEVANIASIHDSILNFQDGYETIIGERGVTLSGGQKQRVSIARTLMEKAPILIFDDSLSAVDTETDRKIRQELRKNLNQATVILISHRITTLMECEQILVLEEGEISAMGTHSELLAQEGIYREIFAIQHSDLP